MTSIINQFHESEPARQDLLQRFTESPNDDVIWQTAFQWARQEDQTGPATDEAGKAIAADIPADELIALAERVRTTDPTARYEIMLDRASNGQRWFDTLATFSSPQINEAVSDTLQSWVSDSQQPFERALDLGTGTGKTLGVLEPYAEQVVGVDQNAQLLAAAKEVASDHTQLVPCSIYSLPFEAQSFDLISSFGITGSLKAPDEQRFYTELRRVMTDYGVYIEGNYWQSPDGDWGDEYHRATASAKAMLADMIVDTVSGKHLVTEELTAAQRANLLDELGLHQTYFETISPDGQTHNVIRVITK